MHFAFDCGDVACFEWQLFIILFIIYCCYCYLFSKASGSIIDFWHFINSFTYLSTTY